MPEHVHLLLTEPERSTLAAAIQALKQSASQRLSGHHGRFWANPLLRLQRVQFGEAGGEIGVHPPQSSRARAGETDPRIGPGVVIATTLHESREWLKLIHHG